MTEESLIKSPHHDELAVKIKLFQQQRLKAELEAEKEQKIADEKKLIEYREAQFARSLKTKKGIYEKLFIGLAEKYFSLNNEFLKNLPDDQLTDLINCVLNEAKRKLWWKIPIYHFIPVASLGALLTNIHYIATIGNEAPWLGATFVFALFFFMANCIVSFCFWHKQCDTFPDLKIRLLHEWYMENYGLKVLKDSF